MGVTLEGQTKEKWVLMRRQRIIARHSRLRSCKRSTRALGKRRLKRLEASRRYSNAIQRRVKTLKDLIPNTKPEGLDGLFRETAKYILALQTKVRVMQTMVDVLSEPNRV